MQLMNETQLTSLLKFQLVYLKALFASNEAKSALGAKTPCYGSILLIVTKCKYLLKVLITLTVSVCHISLTKNGKYILVFEVFYSFKFFWKIRHCFKLENFVVHLLMPIIQFCRANNIFPIPG